MFPLIVTPDDGIGEAVFAYTDKHNGWNVSIGIDVKYIFIDMLYIYRSFYLYHIVWHYRLRPGVNRPQSLLGNIGRDDKFL